MTTWHPQTETQAEFEERYGSDKTRHFVKFGDNFVSLRCYCDGGGGGKHWATINNTPEAIAMHMEFDGLSPADPAAHPRDESDAN